MKIFLKQVCLLGILFIFFSCENDDNSTPNSFFNLSVGNEWVYKTYYNSNPSNPESEYVFTGTTETLKVVEIVEHEGFTFYKIEKTRQNNPIPSYTYWRINNSGHLVQLEHIYDLSFEITEETGSILHPGTDENHITVIEDFFGSVEYRLYNRENILVEGNNYDVYPYKGVVTPREGYEHLASIQTQYYYQRNLGLVKSIIYGVSSGAPLEHRLVSYKIN